MFLFTLRPIPPGIKWGLYLSGTFLYNHGLPPELPPVYNPEVLLLDEPLSAIDPVGKAEFVELIGKLSRDKLIIVTSHDPMLFLRYTEEIVVLNRTFYKVGKPDEILTLDVLSEVYGESAMKVEDHVHISDAH